MLMMISIQDIKTGVYDPPVSVKTYVEIERMIHQTVSEGRSTIARYPRDFTIWHVANFYESEGIIEPLETRYNLGIVADIHRNQEEQLANQVPKKDPTSLIREMTKEEQMDISDFEGVENERELKNK